MGAKVNFDEITKIITVTLAPVSGEVFIDVKVDLYSDGKEDWVVNENLRKFAFPITTVGGNPLPGSKALGATFFLASDWKIRPYEASHKLVINGNLYSEDGSDPFLDTIGTYTVRIIQQVSSLVDSTIQQLSEIEYASFGGGVTIDVINGVEGTDFPSGTKETPVDNLTDAVAIANGRGFDTLFINKSMLLDDGTNIESFTLIGKSAINTYVGIDPSALCANINIERCNISGTLDGGTSIHDCNISDLDYIYGHIDNCGLYGTIVLGGNEEAVMVNCFTIDQDNPPIIDMAVSGQDLALLNYSGIVTIRNLSSDSEEIAVGLNAGRVILEDTITAGTIIITGAGTLVDNSTGTADVNTDGLMSKATISQAIYEEIGSEIQYASFGGGVTLNVVTGVSGTVFPTGTVESPVNNLLDAVAIADSRGFHTLFINESMTLDSGTDIQDFNIIGRSISDTNITIAPSAICGHLGIQHCNVSGTLDGGTRVRDCLIGNIEYVNGHVFNSFLYGTIVLAGNEDAVFANCGISDPNNIPTIDMGGSGQNAIITDYSGGIKFKNMTGPNKIAIQIDGGRVYLEDTISAGFVGITGTGELFDSSTGATVVTTGLMSKDTISSAVWDESIAEHLVDGSSGRAQGIAQFNNFVTINTASGIGVAGTAFPIGTEANPVNNIADANTIATSMGINRLHFMSDFTFDNTVYIANYDLYGQGRNSTTFTFESGCIVAYCATYNAKITGLSLGLTYMNNCLIFDYGGSGLAPSDKTVVAENCIIGGAMAVPSNYTGVLKALSCYTGVNAAGLSSAIIDTDGADFKLVVKGHSGDLKIINSTHADSYYSLDFESGGLELDSSVTAGNFTIRGVGLLTDNSIGTTSLTIDGLVNKQTVAAAIWDESIAEHLIDGSSGRSQGIAQFNNFVTINTTSGIGVAGTTFPIGTEAHPVNNIVDANTIATSLGINKFNFTSDFTFDNTVYIANYDLCGQGRSNTKFTFESGCIVAYCATFDAEITGLSLGLTYMYNCLISNYGGSGLAPSDKTVVTENCIVDGEMVVPSNYTGVLKVLDCYTGINSMGVSSIVLNVNGANFKLVVREHSGELKIINSTHADSYYSMDFESGSLELDDSNTAGTFVVRGIGLLTDNSTGTTVSTVGLVNKNTVAHAVWDTLVTDCTVSGTTGKLLSNIEVEVEAVTVKLPSGDIAESGEYTTLLNNMETYILRNLGLNQENYYLDQTIYTDYQGAKLLTSGRVRIYEDAASVGTNLNVTATYNIISTWTGAELQTYKVVKT